MSAKTQKLEVNTELVVPLKIQDKDTTITTETMNITSAGAYCKTDRPLPLLSKVALTLLVPQANKKRSEQNRRIECKGTVVRIHPVAVDGVTQSYDVAIYFDEMNANDKQTLSNYIEESLSGKEQA